MFGIESYKNNEELIEEQFKIKYLKYKQKYNELKQSGGTDSVFAYLTTEEKANKLVDLFNNCSLINDTTPPFNVDEVGELIFPSINVTNNINNTEFGTFVETEKQKFNKLVEVKKNQAIESIKSEKAKFEKLLNDKLVSCKTRKNEEIVDLLDDNAYKIKVGDTSISLVCKKTNFYGKCSNENKNSSTISKITQPFKLEDTLLNAVVSNINTSNLVAKKDYTKPTHYVLIEESFISSKSKLHGDGKPKPLPSQTQSSQTQSS